MRRANERTQKKDRVLERAREEGRNEKGEGSNPLGVQKKVRIELEKMVPGF